MTDADFNTAKNIKARIKELEEVLSLNSTITLSGNLPEQERVYVHRDIINSNSKMLDKIKEAIKEEIKELNEKFNKL